MADIYDTGFAGHTDISTGIINATAAARVVTELALFKALIPDPTASVVAVHPDFDGIRPATASRLRTEFDLLAAAIAAAPTA